MSSQSHLRTVTNKKLPVAASSPQASWPPEVCPVSGTIGHKVRQFTLGNHLRPEQWRWGWQKGFHFCSQPDCSVVYYHNGLRTYFSQEKIRTRVRIKNGPGPVPVCYCMNATEEQIVEEIRVKRCCDSLEDIKQYTKARTGKLCPVTNPAGKCCGKHVTAVVEKALAELPELNLRESAHAIWRKILEE